MKLSTKSSEPKDVESCPLENIGCQIEGGAGKWIQLHMINCIWSQYRPKEIFLPLGLVQTEKPKKFFFHWEIGTFFWTALWKYKWFSPDGWYKPKNRRHFSSTEKSGLSGRKISSVCIDFKSGVVSTCAGPLKSQQILILCKIIM